MNLDRILTLTEARTLLEATAAGRTPNGRLSHAIVRLGLEAGLRNGEMCRLRVDDCALDTERPHLRIRESKGGKSRDVLIGEPLAACLRDWTRHYRPETSAPELLVSVRRGTMRDISDGGTTASYGRPLTTRSVEARFKRILARAGLPEARRETLTPHSMRHTYATRMIEAGCNLAFIRDQLRHSNISTTNIYLQVADVDGRRPVALYV